jgi:hypothetical protein
MREARLPALPHHRHHGKYYLDFNTNSKASLYRNYQTVSPIRALLASATEAVPTFCDSNYSTSASPLPHLYFELNLSSCFTYSPQTHTVPELTPPLNTVPRFSCSISFP